MKDTNTPYVFLSWSGEQSRKVAKEFSDLFEAVFTPTIKCFMSNKDISPGMRSISKLFEMLEKCNYGVCFINYENARAPWIQFEAGALSKIVDESQVMVLILDDNIDCLYGTPLNEFQHKLFSEDDIRSIFEEIIKKFNLSDEKESFIRRFNINWKEFYDNSYKALVMQKDNKQNGKVDQFPEKEELDSIKKMLLNMQNILKTDYSQTVRESITLLSELKRILKTITPEELKDMKMQFKVQRYELVFQQNIQNIEDAIDDLDIDGNVINIDTIEKVKEKLNNIISRTMSLIND